MTHHRALIFANGRIHDGPMPRRALEQAPDALMIGADGGVRVAQAYGVKLDAVIGDMDSLTEDELEVQQAQGAKILRYPPEKNETDLELALLWAAEQGADWMRVFGAMGGRLDQTLANIYLLALPPLRQRDVRLVSRAQQAWLLYPGEHRIEGAEGDTISLIPMNGDAQGVETENLYYPLRNEALTFGPARGVSNVMSGAQASVRFRAGLLLVVHTIGRA
ncbi:MAG TPA: thiamine diphosphokinase [Spirillospora sp.]|nr:thiamine diphosphokinase [Spirillospora sp.]